MRRPLVGRTSAGEFVLLSLFGLFLSGTEAFETGHMPVPLRLLYWQMALVGGGLIAALIEPLAARRLKGRPVLFVVAQLILMTPPVTAWVTLIPVVVFGPEAMATERFLPLLPQVLVVNLALVVLAILTRRVLSPAAQGAAPADVPPAPIRAKLTPKLARARLIAVEAEDHYLRIRTEAGHALILMRLTDALEALEGADGFRVHRSWWVARGAVQTARWRDGRGALTLSDGAVAPVSRTYAPTLRDTDWAAPVA